MLGVVAEEERGRHLVVKMVMIAIRVVKRILLISTIVKITFMRGMGEDCELWGRWGEQEREERSAIRGPGAARLKGDEATLLNWVKEEEEEVEEGRSHSREQSQSSGLGERRKEGGEERFDT